MLFLFLITTFLMPTREWLKSTYLPSLEGRILYVGVGDYTARYPFLTKSPTLFETIDYDAKKAAFGSPYGHHVMEFVHFQPTYQYDHICLYGVLGFPPVTPTSFYSLTDRMSVERAIDHAHQMLKVGETLQLGPNYDLTPGQDEGFWNEIFATLSDRYDCFFLGKGPKSDNLIWWGRKKKE